MQTIDLNKLREQLNALHADRRKMACEKDVFLFDNITAIPHSRGTTRLDMAVFGLCQEGEGVVEVDNQCFSYHKGSYIALLPNQVVQLVENQKGRGIFICLSSETFSAVVRYMKDTFSLFLYIRENPCSDIPLENMWWIEKYHKQIFREMQESDNMFRNETAHALLIALLYKICNIYGHKLIGSHSRQEEIFKEYMYLVSTHYKVHRDVVWYAEQMYLTPKYMSTAIRKASGRTASEWIQNYVLQEAKMLLLKSDKTIQQIALELNFSSQSLFGKWFKSQTSMSPSEYRTK